MEKTKTKKRLLLFVFSVLSGFTLSGMDYFMSPEFSRILRTDTLFSQPAARILPAERYRYTIVDNKEKVIHLQPNVQQDVKFEIKNTGKFSWNVQSNSDTTTVNPGKNFNLKLNIKAPANPGFYTEIIKPLVADSKWTINNKMDLGLVVDGNFDKSYQYEIVNEESLDLMAKVSRPVTLKIRNTGKVAWFNYGRFPIQLNATAIDNSWLSEDIIATMQEPEIAPGQVATFYFDMTAPADIPGQEFKFNLAIGDAYVFQDSSVLDINILSKKVALTFDDGYGDIGAFIDLLNRENVRGTFFMLGCVAEKNPDAMRRIVDEGHLLANHSYCHPDLRTLTDDGIRWQLNRTREVMQEITGKDIHPYFRYPYGGMNDYTNNILREEGWIYFPWTQDTGDYRYHQNSDAGRRHIYHYATLNPPDKSNVLMHIISKSSLAVLPDIIQWYRTHGYTFVTVDQM